MHSRPRKILALVLCCQPVLWMSNVALAQSLLQASGAGLGADRPGSARGRGLAPAGSVTVPEPDDAAGVEAETGGPRLPTTADTLRLDTRSPAQPLPPLDQPIDPATYVLGPGDQLEINLWGLQNLKLPAVVDLEGRTFIPRIGYLTLAGRTLSEARALLRDMVARYYPRLGFDVALARPRTFLVQAVGAVARPGSYPARATDRVSSFLRQAGNLVAHGSRRRIEIRRKGGVVVPVDLEMFLLTGDVSQDPFLRDGDVVAVPYVSLTARAEGAVNRPGEYELIGTKDVAELIQLAGGLASTATRLVPMTIVRRGADDAQDLLQLHFPDVDGLPAAALQRGDVVRVAGFDELQRSIMVTGAITGVTRQDEPAATRRLGFVEGDTVRTLLARVGGVGPLADLEGAYLLRDGASIPVDLKALVMLKDLAADRPVQLGDALVIPFRRPGILVEGAVFAPGLYPYNPRFGVREYLALAGGQNRFAREIDEVRLVTPYGKTLTYQRDLKVEPGSSLVVPERNFSRSEMVQIAIAVAGVLLSGAALYITTKK